MSYSFERTRAQREQRIEIRQQLADAQIALTDAIQNHDSETISEARRAYAEAIERLRGLTHKRGRLVP